MTAKTFLRKFPEVDEINENCLRDMACPKCGNRDGFKICASTTFEMGDGGEEDHDNIDYDDKSECGCMSCEHWGYVKQFTIDGLDEALEAKQ